MKVRAGLRRAKDCTVMVCDPAFNDIVQRVIPTDEEHMIARHYGRGGRGRRTPDKLGRWH